jgi:hypothetical protein
MPLTWFGTWGAMGDEGMLVDIGPVDVGDFNCINPSDC